MTHPIVSLQAMLSANQNQLRQSKKTDEPEYLDNFGDTIALSDSIAFPLMNFLSCSPEVPFPNRFTIDKNRYFCLLL